MTRDEIILMTREAGFDWHANWVGDGEENRLETFAALIEARAVARTREECAALCDGQAALWKHPKYHYAQAVGNHCAAAIRALGERT